MDNAKKNLYTNSRKKIFHDWQTTYHVTQQQFMFVKAKINERKTNKKKSNMMNYYVLCICIKLFFESWTKKKLHLFLL